MPAASRTHELDRWQASARPRRPPAVDRLLNVPVAAFISHHSGATIMKQAAGQSRQPQAPTPEAGLPAIHQGMKLVQSWGAGQTDWNGPKQARQLSSGTHAGGCQDHPRSSRPSRQPQAPTSGSRPSRQPQAPAPGGTRIILQKPASYTSGDDVGTWLLGAPVRVP
jgi:hypothetical protein